MERLRAELRISEHIFQLFPELKSTLKHCGGAGELDEEAVRKHLTV